jgi:hypothetical protein
MTLLCLIFAIFLSMIIVQNQWIVYLLSLIIVCTISVCLFGWWFLIVLGILFLLGIIGSSNT